MGFFKSISKKISKFLKYIDLYGRKIDLTINQEETYKTNIGGFFTLIIGILSLMLFINFGSDMFYHDNPSVTFAEIYSQTPEREYFSKEKYFFMFGIEGPNGQHFIDESVYKVEIKHLSTNKLNSKEQIKETMEVEKCTESHLPTNPQLKNYFMTASGSPLDQLYCVKNLDKYFIEGSFDSYIYSYLEINIKTCTNSTNENTTNEVEAVPCKNSDFIKKQMGGYFAFYTVDYLIDPRNFKDPGYFCGKSLLHPDFCWNTKNNR